MSEEGFRTPVSTNPGAVAESKSRTVVQGVRGRGRGGASRPSTSPNTRVFVSPKVGRTSVKTASLPSRSTNASGQYADYVLIDKAEADTCSTEHFGNKPLGRGKGARRSIHSISGSPGRTQEDFNISMNPNSQSLMAHNTSSSQATPTLDHCRMIGSMPIKVPTSSVSQHSLPSPSDILQVSGLTDEVDEIALKLYFEDKVSGGEPGAVKSCQIISGQAFITFCNTQVASHVLAKQTHEVEGVSLSLKPVQEVPESINAAASFVLKNIPERIDRLHIELALGTFDGVSVTDVINHSCTVHLPPLSNEEIQDRLKSIKRLSQDITLEKCHGKNALRITSMNKKRTEAFLKRYFINENQSGGGELSCDPELLANGTEAVISFQQPEVRERVLLRNHEKAFGSHVQLEPAETIHSSTPQLSEAPSPTMPQVDLTPVELPIDSDIARALHKHPLKLNNFGKTLNVTFKVQLEHVHITPSERSSDDWCAKCEDFLEKTYSKCEMWVTPDARNEMQKQFGSYTESSSAFIAVQRSSTDHSTCFTLAGELDVLQALENHKKKIESFADEKLEVSGCQFDFLIGMKLDQYKTKYPAVQISFHTANKFLFVLKGPFIFVEQLKQEIEQIIQDLKVIVVDLDQKLVDHFSTTEGQKCIKQFVKKCPLVVSFQCSPHQHKDKSVTGSVLSLVFVCETQHFDWVSTIPDQLKKSAKCKEIKVPDDLACSIDRMEDYQALVLQLKKDHEARIVFDDFKKEISVYGFDDHVTDCVTNLEAFISQKQSAAVPLQVPVSQMLVKALKKKPKDLEQVVSGCNPSLSYAFSSQETEIFISPSTFIGNNWKHQCKAAVDNYIGKFCTIEVAFVNSAAEEVSKLLTDAEQSSQLPFAFDLELPQQLVEIAGENTVAMRLEKQVQDISSSHTVTSKTYPIQPYQHVYLEQVQLEVIKTNHPGVTISLDSNNMVIDGPKIKVADLMERLPNYLKCCTVAAATDPLLADFLSHGHGAEFLQTFLAGKPIAVYHTASQLDFVFDRDFEKSASEMVGEIRSKITVKQLPLPASLKKRNQDVTSRLTDFYKKLEEEHKVICALQDQSSQIAFGGLLSDVMNSVEKMSDFIVKESTVSKEIRLSNLQWKLIKKHEDWIPEIRNWVHKVDVVANGSQMMHVTLQLQGEESKVNAVHQKLLKIKESLTQDTIQVLAPGACNFFQNEDTKTTILPGIESTYNVCIETIALEDHDENEDTEEQPDLTTNSASEYCRVTTKFSASGKNVTFKVFIGDITDSEADVIVNAANVKLRHIGGVAAAIVKQGGREIQEDCDEHIQSRFFDLDEGDVYFSKTVGKLRCKAIAHAVGPKWQPRSTDHRYEESRLSRAVTNTLAKAKKYSTIAFPAVSAGIFGYPIQDCARVHIDASVNFFKTSKSSLTEVSFVVIDQTNAQSFRDALSRHFSGHVLDLEASVYIHESVSSHTAGATLPYPSAPQPISLSKAQPTTVVARVPALHQGDLFSSKITTDVYVCTANTSLDLTRGVIAKKMAELAGPAIQTECNAKAPAKVGDVVVTGLGKLNGKYVFHAVSTNHNSDKDGKILRSILQKCFTECDKHPEVNSIAFPPIGPGGLGYPIQLVAQIMISESCAYLAKAKKPSFQVHIVIFESAQYKVFKSEVEKACPKPRKTSKRKRRLFASPHSSVLPMATSVAASPALAEFTVNGIQLSVVKGDITKESSDAVVNTTSAEINLGSSGQVSKILLKTAGSKLQELCTAAVKQEGRLTEGKVIHTKALKPLKCSFLLHIYFHSSDPAKYIETIKTCLAKAEQLQCTTVSLPAIGTGAHNYPTSDAAKGTLEGLKQFALTRPQHMKQVRIVIFNEAIYDDFLVAVQPTQSPSHSAQADTIPEAEDSAFSDNEDGFDSEDDFEEHEAVGSPSTFSSWSTTDVTPALDDEVSHSLTAGDTQTGLKLLICGFKDTEVTKAVERLNKLMRENFSKDEIKDESIRSLTDNERKEIQSKCRALGVECRIESDIGRIRLAGNVKEITVIKSTVHSIIREVFSRKHKERDEEFHHTLQVETFYHSVHWQYKKKGTLQYSDYDKEVSYEIEQAFQEFRKHPYKNIFQYQKGPYNFTINFAKQQEEDHKTKQTSQVRRFDKQKNTDKRPDYWEDMPDQVPVYCADLKPDDLEYKRVLDAFNKTMTKGNYTDIVKIQRVQNPGLYALYQQKREEMNKANPPNHQNERQLFHGTDNKSVRAINANSFNRVYAGKHAKAYGVGTYFARDASYSASPTYSQPDSNGHRHMYYARVLVGEYTVGNSGMMVPPSKDPKKDSTILFDSLVNRMQDPTIFVVGHDAQAYPEYLITFK